MKLSVSLLLCWAGLLMAQPDQTFHWRLGERLVYQVEYGFMNLGTIDMEVWDTVTYKNRNLVHVHCRILSNPALFFLDMDEEYHSYIDSRGVSYRIYGHGNIQNENQYFDFQFDYDHQQVIMSTGKSPQSMILNRSLPLTEDRAIDGFSMYYFARANLLDKQPDSLSCYVNLEVGPATFGFPGYRTRIEHPLTGKTVPVIHLKGFARVIGIAGFIGDWQGWWTLNSTRVPIVAKMKAWIGSVTITLKKETVEYQKQDG